MYSRVVVKNSCQQRKSQHHFAEALVCAKISRKFYLSSTQYKKQYCQTPLGYLDHILNKNPGKTFFDRFKYVQRYKFTSAKLHGGEGSKTNIHGASNKRVATFFSILLGNSFATYTSRTFLLQLNRVRYVLRCTDPKAPRPAPARYWPILALRQPQFRNAESIFYKSAFFTYNAVALRYFNVYKRDGHFLLRKTNDSGRGFTLPAGPGAGGAVEIPTKSTAPR